MAGVKAPPTKLKRYINNLAAAFRRENTRKYLPASISGAWKADLFLGMPDVDRWVASTVKINSSHLEGARGLRLGIVPSSQGRNDKIYKDEHKNLIVCPLPYDHNFMQYFYHAWIIVQNFLASDAVTPKEAALPTPSHRMVARLLEERREFTVLDVIEGLSAAAQPHLLKTNLIDSQQERNISVSPSNVDGLIGTLLAPKSLQH